MTDIEARIRAALGDFYNDPLFMAKLATIAVQIFEDDQDFVPDYLLELISLGDGYALLTTRMSEFFAVEDISPNADYENTRFFQALPDTAAFVLSNNAIPPVVIEKCASVFQDFFLRLRELAKTDPELAKATLFYGVAMALYEWKDRRRGGTPYDLAFHGPITFASGPRKN